MYVSLSARRAWIEIGKNIARLNPKTVALRKESVDRNTRLANILVIAAKVALRKESVDRNAADNLDVNSGKVSLSARRAWIEMHHGGIDTKHPTGRSPQGERG